MVMAAKKTVTQEDTHKGTVMEKQQYPALR